MKGKAIREIDALIAELFEQIIRNKKVPQNGSFGSGYAHGQDNVAHMVVTKLAAIAAELEENR